MVYACSLLLSGAVLLTSAHALPAFHETQWYAGLAFVFLYLTLAVGPLQGTPWLASHATGMEARRALGLSTCYFALLHSYFGFYRFVGGLDGLRYWSRYFAWSLFAGLLRSSSSPHSRSPPSPGSSDAWEGTGSRRNGSYTWRRS